VYKSGVGPPPSLESGVGPPPSYRLPPLLLRATREAEIATREAEIAKLKEEKEYPRGSGAIHAANFPSWVCEPPLRAEDEVDASLLDNPVKAVDKLFVKTKGHWPDKPAIRLFLQGLRQLAEQLWRRRPLGDRNCRVWLVKVQLFDSQEPSGTTEEDKNKFIEEKVQEALDRNWKGVIVEGHLVNAGFTPSLVLAGTPLAPFVKDPKGMREIDFAALCASIAGDATYLVNPVLEDEGGSLLSRGNRRPVKLTKGGLGEIDWYALDMGKPFGSVCAPVAGACCAFKAVTCHTIKDCGAWRCALSEPHDTGEH
jgi:hypothetical protein